MINELNFKNLTIKYDGNRLSKSKIRNLHAIEIFACFALVILFFGIIVLEVVFLDIENNFALSMFIVIASELIILYGGIFGIVAFIKNLAPKHYEFVSWLMKFKKDEIEIGWFNNRYIVQIFSRDWHIKELDNFIPEYYYIEDESDKSKPVHMTIDLSKNDIKIIVENR